MRRGPRLPYQIPPEILGQPLTPREQEVLRLRAQGLTNVQVAEALHISDNTVKKHMTAVLLKLGMHKTGQACYIVYGCDEVDCPARVQRPAP